MARSGLDRLPDSHVPGIGRRWAVPVATLAIVLAGCGGSGGSSTTLEPGPTVAGFAFTGGSAVVDGEAIARRHTCDGDDVSPALAWTGVPESAVELALVVDDPDAPGGSFTHWLVWGLDPETAGLQDDERPALEGTNDFGSTGYGGPCPPAGEEHRYVFRLLALDAPIELERGASRAEFDAAATSHLTAEARLTGTYQRT